MVESWQNAPQYITKPLCDLFYIFIYFINRSLGIFEGALWLGRGSRTSVAGAWGREALHRLWCAGRGQRSVFRRSRRQAGCHCWSGPPGGQVSASSPPLPGSWFLFRVTPLLHLTFYDSSHRFVEYWARIGSEDNMTMCHRPTCRKEGVLLDYSTDGGEQTTT